jgi:hypothetical protein
VNQSEQVTCLFYAEGTAGCLTNAEMTLIKHHCAVSHVVEDLCLRGKRIAVLTEAVRQDRYAFGLGHGMVLRRDLNTVVYNRKRIRMKFAINLLQIHSHALG